MPTAEELLSRTLATSTDSAIDDNRFIISEDLRTITVPNSQKIIGVTNDLDVRRIWFSMPKRCDGLDLSTFTPYVNFRNAAGEEGFYMATDLQAEEDILTFSWVVSRRACARDGEVTFSVTLRKMAQDGTTILNEFNTTTQKMVCLVGLSTTGQSTVERYADELAEYIEAALDQKILEMGLVTIAAQVATKTELPTTDVEIGEVRNVTDTGRNYMWNGSEWDDLGGLDAFNVTFATDAQIDAMFA